MWYLKKYLLIWKDSKIEVVLILLSFEFKKNTVLYKTKINSRLKNQIANQIENYTLWKHHSTAGSIKQKKIISPIRSSKKMQQRSLLRMALNKLKHKFNVQSTTRQPCIHIQPLSSSTSSSNNNKCVFRFTFTL